MLKTEDLAGTILFYEEKLGFRCTNQMPGEWANQERDGRRLMFSAPTAHRAFEDPVITG